MITNLLALVFMSLGRDAQIVRQMSYRNSDKNVPLMCSSDKSTYFFRSKMSCDVDGAPNAYHPEDDGVALDTIVSAEGLRDGGAVKGHLVTQPSPSIIAYLAGKPFIQVDGEFKGFFVSKTSYENKDMLEIDSGRYLDARHIQYIVLPNGLVPEAALGDLAVVYDPISKKSAFAIFGDIGPSSESGEASLATLQRIGFDVRDGKFSPAEERRDMCFAVFLGTAAILEKAETWPHTQSTIDRLAQAELDKRGGLKSWFF